MAKKDTLKSRAWNHLRLALFSSNRGILKGRSMVDSVSSYFKRSGTAAHDLNPYQERQFSFNKTPLFHFKSHKAGSARFQHLPHFPCINPPVDFNDAADGGGDFYRGSCESISVEHKEVEDRWGGEEMEVDGVEEEVVCNEEEIDSKAEEFIARFHQQMKMQRQLSNVQYMEMLDRGMS